WYRDSKIDNDQDFLIQHNPISLCMESPSNNYSVTNHTFNFEHIMQLQEVIDIAINSNSYDELIGLYQQFLTNKQLLDNQSENIPIANPIITARRGRPPGRAKSDVEIQDSITKKRHNTDKSDVEIQELNAKKCRYLSNTDTNIQLPDNR
ncbi:3198_t:CDS:2, partial [Gigaspora margarita]